MIPARSHDVTNNKMKSNLIKNTIGPHLNHSQISLSLKTPIKIVEQLVKALVDLVIFKTFTTIPNKL